MLRRKKQAQPPQVDRYDGRPFLRLLDSYVLHVAGLLDDESLRRLKEMEPKLVQTYDHPPGLTWDEAVEAEMQFGPTLAPAVRDLWNQTVQKAAASGAEPDPLVWAQQVVDKNFS